MIENYPSYYAVIPAYVRYAKLPPNAKLLYGEITALCNKQGYCWAKNSYFSELYSVTESTISDWIKKLEVMRFIKIENPKGMKRIIRIVNKYSEPSGKPDGNHLENPTVNRLENPTHNNTRDNNKTNTKNILDSVEEKQIREIISAFQCVNASYKNFFERKQERAAVTRLLKLMGFEKLKATVEFLPNIKGQPYAPTVLRPTQLEEKLANIEAFLMRKKNEKVEEIKGRAIIA